ncbi:58c5affb-ca0c-4fcb-8d11-31365e5198a9 [Sclerotinia trifoliorum]|uniref:58c5affb-ca0c-4fcb-8d11-31365e5198a9 n=1 Tax=Sclerotinia trifoliorum TaxID=28548 RepID=A0A8H2ZLW2_9HELO|nr:58c5affb-ca0c-4fcb-8d11-31365e5198a9 [Sclerotinia trifoliorum]
MTFLSTTYLLPGILLNPAFILHLMNTFMSHLLPPPPTMSTSPHPIFESLGPLPGSQWAFDMHEDDALCWRYTAVMVIIQMWVFGRVSGNRISMKDARAVRIERERVRRERSALIDAESTSAKSTNGLDGICEVENGRMGRAELVGRDNEVIETSDDSTTETSEEEIIV